MDPATIAGLALGIIPLIISAVENYEVTFQPFVTYHRYAGEIAKFATKLSTQKTIFNNQCQVLLQATNADLSEIALDYILQEPRHTLRYKGPLSDGLEAILGTSLEQCVSLMQLVKKTLAEITEETKGFHALINKQLGEKRGFSHFRSKIKISFSKTRLNTIINELREYNEDLVVLSKQFSVVRLQISAKKAALPVTISELKTAQQASRTLYSLLVSKWVCRDETDHAASLSLDVETQQRSQIAATSFLLSMECIFRSPRAATTSSTVWLKVDSKPRTEDEEEEESGYEAKDDTTMLINAMKPFEIMPGHPPQPSPSDKPEEKIAPITAGTFQPEAEKLCAYFQTLPLEVHNPGKHSCHSEKISSFEHSVYKCHPPSGAINESVSLGHILKDGTGTSRRETWVSKFKLARLLTLGVLRFQSTPWIPENLTSNDVYFLENVRSGEQVCSLQEPFLHAQLSHGAGAQPAVHKGKGRQLAQNELLFNLGVIFLELGYEAPLQRMTTPEDSEDGSSATCRYTDFFTARRLGKAVSRDLDARYGRIVKKCLDCDFGAGDDLSSAELQYAIVTDIVKDLDRSIQAEDHFNNLFS